MRTLPIALAMAAASTLPASAQTPQPTSPPRAIDTDPMGASTIEQLREEAGRLMPLVKTDGVRKWLIATNWLPAISTRRVYFDRAGRRACGQEAWEKLPETDRAAFKLMELDEHTYYYTKYGSPLAYARLLDLACEKLGGGDCFPKKRILDFGYGGIGHLRLLASCGADVTGIEVDPLLRELYSEKTDTGEISGVGMGDAKAPPGRITLVDGRWPADADIRTKVGAGFDVLISKNTLKKGYIHPAKEVDKRMLIDLGVDDDAFLHAAAAALNPAGLFIIYNICPKQQEEKYIPWADGQSPFTREAFEKAGFEVLDFDRDESAQARQVGRALGWDRGENPMDLENDTFAWVTIARRR